MEGSYSATVSNSLGMVISRSAILTVNDGLVTNIFATLLDVTNTWRFDASGRDLGKEWRFSAYDDSGWSNGAALFGIETTPNIYPLPFLTPFSLTAVDGSPIQTYYLRTTFSVSEPASLAGLIVGAFVDDGAVWYVNGREGARLRIASVIPVDEVTHSINAQTINPENQAASLFIPATNLVAGDNLLAVELHQSHGGTPSSDVVFGMAMSSFTAVTNGPVLLMPQPQPGGGVEVTLEGISGRNYALDVSTNLADWSRLVTWTNFTGSARYLDAAGVNGNRFYRGRLAP
jgi:hypothetical protein